MNKYTELQAQITALQAKLEQMQPNEVWVVEFKSPKTNPEAFFSLAEAQGAYTAIQRRITRYVLPPEDLIQPTETKNHETKPSHEQRITAGRN